MSNIFFFFFCGCSNSSARNCLIAVLLRNGCVSIEGPLRLLVAITWKVALASKELTEKLKFGVQFREKYFPTL